MPDVLSTLLTEKPHMNQDKDHADYFKITW